MSETVKPAEPIILKKNRLTSKLYIKMLMEMCIALNTPISLSIYLQVKYSEKISTDIKPSNYLDASSYLRDAQALAFFKKNPHYDCGLNKAQIALDNFLIAEEQCAITNDFFREHHGKPKPGLLWQILFSARHFCMKILSPEIPSLKPSFGPGATISLKKEKTNLVSKMSTVPEVTPELYEYSLSLLEKTCPHYLIAVGLATRLEEGINIWGRPNVAIGNSFSTVPKDWRTDRPICIEPGINMLIQKAYGTAIRSKLKKFGLDLDKTPERHESLACEGSILDNLSTIDLSAASDTISYEFVRFILPDNWFDALKQARSARTVLPDNSVIWNEKFSSMGNGFTFELESLLFYCILLAVRKHVGSRSDVISTFGDDIICSKSLATTVVEVLTFAGFIINTEKSFIAGNFKESCGADFLGGKNVRPIYFKGLSNKLPIERLYYFLNRIRKMAFNLNFGIGCDSLFFDIWKSVLRRIPKNFRFFGPEDFGDAVILGNFSYRFKSLKKRYVRKYWSRDPHVQLACALYGVTPSGVVARSTKYRLTVSRNYQPCADKLWVDWV